MTAQEYLNLTWELNDALEENKFFEEQGLCFNYRTYGFADIIYFGDQALYCSEDYSEREYISIKKVVIKNFKGYVKALKSVKL